MNRIVRPRVPLLMTLVCVLFAFPLGCTTEAAFDVRSLVVTPSEANVGEEAIVTAVLRNDGGAQGTYDAILTVDGDEVARESLLIDAETSKTVTFVVTQNVAGSYELGLGDMRATLVVVKEEEVDEEPAPTPEGHPAAQSALKYIELKYDDGEADGSKAFGSGPRGYGHVVRFTPTTTPFTVERVKIYGKAYGEGCEAREVQVTVRDRDFNQIDYGCCSHSEFTEAPGWVTIDMPGVTVKDEFYVVVMTDSPQECGISVFFDSDSDNQHSEYVKDLKLAEWSIEPPKDKVNWMIRVEQGVPTEEDATTELQSLDYFPVQEGHSITYRVSDDGDGLDCVVLARAVHPEPIEDREFDFDFELLQLESTKGSFPSNKLAGSVNRDARGRALTMFWFGHPSSNQGNFYALFALPWSFVSEETWGLGDRTYSVQHVGTQTVGSVQFDDCIRVTVDNSKDERGEYLQGTGEFVLAKDMGIVWLKFQRVRGTTVTYEYVEHREAAGDGAVIAAVQLSIDPENETVCNDGMRRWTVHVNETNGVGITVTKLETQYYHDETSYPNVRVYTPADNDWLPEYLGPYEGFSFGAGFNCGPGVNEDVNRVVYRLEGLDDNGSPINEVQGFSLF